MAGLRERARALSRAADTPQRILYVANQACGNPALCAEVRAHADAGTEVLVVAPVLSSPLHRWRSDEAEDQALAEARLEARAPLPARA
jgi:hypothetical protein